MSQVVLYSTDGCHLCELAQAQLDTSNTDYKIVDIIDDVDLVNRFGTRIPVVLNKDNKELGWPFELAELQQFLG